jgi:altronate hydrolase
MTPNIVILHPRDNVVVALGAIAAGETVTAHDGETIATVADIPPSHKIARVDIAAGAEIIKYGEIVAVSTRDIRRGEWVHTHNLQSKVWKR